MVTVSEIPEPPDDAGLEVELLLQQLPHMAEGEFEVKSISTPEYNCIAWALGDCEKPWSPALQGGYAWPEDLPVGVPTVRVVADVFRRRGYEESASAELVPGIEKVALYADALGEVRHAARLRSDGLWASKMGDLADIVHRGLELIEGALFGNVALVMERVRQGPEPGDPIVVVPAIQILRRGHR